MPNCPLYQVHRQTLRSNEITGTRQAAVSVVTVPYCEHEHSPMPRAIVRTIGAGTRLQCGGDLARCQVPADRR
jgi:hypothetical protein